MPVLHLLAGPNGAGKSTYVHDVLTPAMNLPFINADIIATERWPDAQPEHSYEAAKIAESQRRHLMAAGTSFVTETVFSHPSKITLLADASALGYLVHLHVIMVPVELAVQRVTERVRRGGHPVPANKIKARYDRLWPYVAAAIQVVDLAEIFDNSSARNPFRLCAAFEHGAIAGESGWPKWAPGVLTDPPRH